MSIFFSSNNEEAIRPNEEPKLYRLPLVYKKEALIVFIIAFVLIQLLLVFGADNQTESFLYARTISGTSGIKIADNKMAVQNGKTTDKDSIKRCFYIREGLTSNYLFQTTRTSAHILMTDTERGKIVVAFPAGNSGIALRVDKSDPAMKDIKFSFIDKPQKFTSNGMDAGVMFDVQADKNTASFSDVTMDTIRYIRELRYPEYIKWRTDNKSEFLKLAGMPEEGYLYPSIKIEQKNGSKLITYKRQTVDKGNNFYLQIKVPENTQVKADSNGGLSLAAPAGDTLKFTIAASVDYKSLTPYDQESLFKKVCLDYRKKISNADFQKRKKFSKAIQGIEFLSYKEKFLAGSWQYLTYFGRDTIISLLMLKDSITPGAYESGMQSIIDRMSPEGMVAHEEDIGCQATSWYIPKYIRYKKQEKEDEAERVRKYLVDPVYDYKMVDDDFMFPLMVDEYIKDREVADPEKIKFFEKTGALGIKNIDMLLRSYDYLLEKTVFYSKTGDPIDLVRINKDEIVGDWRDSGPGMGWGVYSGNVNLYLVPNGLIAMRDFINSGLYSKADLKKIAKQNNLKAFDRMLEDETELEKSIKIWNANRKHFKVRLLADEMRTAIKDYLENNITNPQERKYYLDIKIGDNLTVNDFVYEGKATESLKDGIEFYALSLYETGKPVQVVNSDIGFLLYLGNPHPSEIKSILETINLPFPIGLADTGGILVSNPIYASDKTLRRTLGRNAYHGMVVWSWQVAMIQKGLIKQIKRFHKKPGYEDLVKEMYTALENIERMEQNCVDLVTSELWTHKFMDGKMTPFPYGVDVKSETESNPVQLWSAVRISTMREMDEIKSLLGK